KKQAKPKDLLEDDVFTPEIGQTDLAVAARPVESELVVTKKELLDMVERYTKLKIDGPHDADGQLAVDEAFKDCRRVWNLIDKAREKKKRFYLDEGNRIQAAAKELWAIEEQAEKHLKAEKDRVEKELAAIVAKQLDDREDNRNSMVEAIGGIPPILKLSVSADFVRVAEPAQFEEFLGRVKSMNEEIAHQAEQQKELDRIKAEQDERQRKLDEAEKEQQRQRDAEAAKNAIPENTIVGSQEDQWFHQRVSGDVSKIMPTEFPYPSVSARESQVIDNIIGDVAKVPDRVPFNDVPAPFSGYRPVGQSVSPSLSSVERRLVNKVTGCSIESPNELQLNIETITGRLELRISRKESESLAHLITSTIGLGHLTRTIPREAAEVIA